MIKIISAFEYFAIEQTLFNSCCNRIWRIGIDSAAESNDNISGKGNNANDTAPTFKVLEEGFSVLSKEENSQLAARQYKYIQNLENALIRIENKTYGVCRMTGKLIPKERLRAVPHATLSVEAKMGQKKQ